jgi:aquaporin Z
MNKYFAELVGTFVLVFGGVGSAVFAGSHIGFAGVAAAFGTPSAQFPAAT